MTHNSMSPRQLKFAQFKSSALGRVIDITLGVVLIWWGSDFASTMEYITVIIGLFALSAGAFNICWAAPIIGIPFRGKDVPSRE